MPQHVPFYFMYCGVHVCVCVCVCFTCVYFLTLRPSTLVHGRPPPAAARALEVERSRVARGGLAGAGGCVCVWPPARANYFLINECL